MDKDTDWWVDYNPKNSEKINKEKFKVKSMVKYIRVSYIFQGEICKAIHCNGERLRLPSYGKMLHVKYQI